MNRPKRTQLLLFAALLPFVISRQSGAQSWEFAPYRIQVWYGGELLERESGLNREAFEAALTMQGRVVAGATWSLGFGDVPAAIEPDLTSAIESVSTELVASIVDPPPEPEQGVIKQPVDKVFLLGLTSKKSRLIWQAREFDVRTRTWSDVATVQVSGQSAVIRGAFQAMSNAFRPVLRIESSEGREAKARIRAGGLVVRPYSPARVTEGSIIQPVIRNNDREGRVRENGIEVVEWTLGVVGASETNFVPIKLHSAFANPLGVRSSRRKQKLALVERRRYESTMLYLKSRDEEQRPMAGYEIYAKDPVSNTNKLLGVTDWRGAVMIEPQEGMPFFLVLYVRNGGKLLGRLPIYVGAHQEVVANVRDDNRRLQAEAFIDTIEGNVLEMVASRELAAARARNHIKEGQLDQAREQVAIIRSLTTPDELRQRLDREQARLAQGQERPDERINTKFSRTKDLIGKFLPRNLPDLLATEIESAGGK
ncbi:MAG: hypothetical protein ABGX07_16655 [Pirellulaceae bacterium]